MNIEQLKGQWKQVKGDAQARWGELTNDELDQVEGNHQKLVGLIQEKYGKTKEEASKEVDAWMES